MTISPENEADCLTKFGVIAMRFRAMDFDGDDCIDVEMFCEEFRTAENTTPEQLTALHRIEQEWRGPLTNGGAARLAAAIEIYCMMRLLGSTVRPLGGAPAMLTATLAKRKCGTG